MLKTDKTEEQLMNRILINLGIGALAYILLHILYARLYMQNFATFLTAGIFALAAAGFYICAAKTGKFKNYGHMFLAFTLALLFTRLSYITSLIIGGQRFMMLINSGYIWKSAFNTQKQVILISILGGVYLLGMLVYNGILMTKAGKNHPKKKTKKK